MLLKKNSVWKNNPINAQNLVFKKLIKSAKKTSFGQEHNFKKINTYDDLLNMFLSETMRVLKNI